MSTPPPAPPVENDLDALWNDFHSAFQATVPDGEEELARVLADAIGAATAELPDGFQFGCAPDRRYLEVETHKPDNGVDKLLVGVCNANTRGVRVRQATLGAGETRRRNPRRDRAHDRLPEVG